MTSIESNTYTSFLTSGQQSSTSKLGESLCQRYEQLHRALENIPMERKRKMNQAPKQSDEHVFLVRHGMTLGEYNLLYFLKYSDNRKRYQRASTEQQSSSGS